MAMTLHRSLNTLAAVVILASVLPVAEAISEMRAGQIVGKVVITL